MGMILVMGIFLIGPMILGALNLKENYTFETLSFCEQNINPFRLPETVVPTHYDLTLSPSLRSMDYNGTVSMDLTVKKSTGCIFLNSEGLKILSAKIENEPSNYYQQGVYISKTQILANVTMIKFTLSEKLIKDQKYKLTIQFYGAIREDLTGFYRFKFVDDSNTEKWGAVTQFESLYARKAFPCFDEPAFKATFNFAVQLQPIDAENDRFKVLSNGAEKLRTALSDGSTIVTFETSPKMSTYLLAFLIGEFDYIEASAAPAAGKSPIKYRVYAPYGKAASGQFALECAMKFTPWYVEFFNVDYALSKMDLVAIENFAAGAMENWGLITFRSSRLLVDPSTTFREIQGVAEVVSHEIAHQWTGNTITMDWWNSLYLNEGFASFFDSLTLAILFPEWNYWEDYLFSTVQPVFPVDSLPSSHPIVISTPLNTTSQIEGIFDSITYNKGSSVLRMIYEFLGMDKFKTWLRTFFAKYQFQNANSQQLLDELKNVPGVDLSFEKLRSWINEAGYPVLSLVHINNNQYKFVQQRFLSSPLKANTTIDTKYWVSVAMVDEEGRQEKIDFDGAESTTFSIRSAWIKANKNQVGLFKVNYPREMWLHLKNQYQAQNPLLSVADRFGLVEDIFSLAFAGLASSDIALDFARTVSTSESKYVIWDGLFSNLGKWSRLLGDAAYKGNFDAFVRQIVVPKYEQLGWTENPADDSDTKQLRYTILSASTLYGHPAALVEARTRYGQISANTSAEMKGILYNAYVKFGGEAEFNEMKTKFFATLDTDPYENSRVLTAMSLTRLPHLLKQLLEMSITSVKQQDGWIVIRNVARNAPVGTQLTYDFLLSNYDAILSRLGARRMNDRILPGVAGLLASSFRETEIISFFSQKAEINPQYLNQVVETIRGNRRFIELNDKALRSYLSGF